MPLAALGSTMNFHVVKSPAFFWFFRFSPRRIDSYVRSLLAQFWEAIFILYTIIAIFVKLKKFAFKAFLG